MNVWNPRQMHIYLMMFGKLLARIITPWARLLWAAPFDELDVLNINRCRVCMNTLNIDVKWVSRILILCWRSFDVFEQAWLVFQIFLHLSHLTELFIVLLTSWYFATVVLRVFSLVAGTLLFSNMFSWASHVMTARPCPHARVINPIGPVLLIMVCSALRLRSRFGTHGFLLTVIDILMFTANSGVLNT